MFNHGMRIVFENRIMSNVLFELMNGTKIWYTDMNAIQRGHADKLLAAQQLRAGGLADTLPDPDCNCVLCVIRRGELSTANH